MAEAEVVYIATGGNRHPAAADWAPGILAYGAGNNIALWNPLDERTPGARCILRGHTDTVNAIRISRSSEYGTCIISGSSDRSLRLWRSSDGSLESFKQWKHFEDHTASVNTISTVDDSCGYFATGAADSTVKLWSFSEGNVELVHSIALKPKFIPLATALISTGEDGLALAVAGTTSLVQIYAGTKAIPLTLQATLSGHEGWIRSLDFKSASDGSITLASTSQDKYIRLWKVRAMIPSTQNEESSMESLSNKIYRIRCGERLLIISYDALLVGHEDWIYTARWAPRSSKNASILLSASADNSLAMWRQEDSTGLWICETRMGEISSLKGSTTATGSTGGFWIGLWSPDGESVVSLGRTGNWRRWALSNYSWNQQIGAGGHVREVQSVSWAQDGSYLLSTSSDQTTRLWASWQRNGICSWHEVARPQIHGYDLNCIAAVTRNQFISGADEKLLRVFNKPKNAERSLAALTGQTVVADQDLPDAANIPVLGLSNKTVTQNEDDDGSAAPSLNLDRPPFEDALARHTLWPEHEKLYGHGYEISAVAVDHAGRMVATACKASTLDHAVIRLYETKDWREVKPALAAHTLTATSLAFSRDDRYLLSVGRDRQWALFEKSETTYKPLTSNPKGHTRMILDCSWASDDVFATAGRDKVVKIWQVKNGTAEQLTSVAAQTAVTAVAFSQDGKRLMYGTEGGDLVLVTNDDSWSSVSSSQLDTSITPSAAISSIAWRPTNDGLVAVASEDTSIRLYKI